MQRGDAKGESRRQISGDVAARRMREDGGKELLRRAIRSSRSTCASSASTVHALDHFPFLQVRRRYATDARRSKIRVLGLDAAQAAQLLVAGFLPLGNECRIGVFLVQRELVHFARDFAMHVVLLVDVATALVVQTEDRPEDLILALSGLIRVLG